MELTKEKSIDQITVMENGIVLVREVTRIVDSGSEIAKSYHRNSYEPGQDMTGAPENVQAICAAAWTPEVVAKWQAQRQ